MATQINWTISQLDCVPQEDGHTDVVVTAHWQCAGVNGTYGQEPIYIAKNYGTASFTYTPESPFTPYADLTQDQVLGWCWANGVNKDATEANVEAEVQALINPPVVTPPLPWAQPVGA